jgi:hypothetical protein
MAGRIIAAILPWCLGTLAGHRLADSGGGRGDDDALNPRVERLFVKVIKASPINRIIQMQFWN